ncbi:hypothetical protein PTTG_26012, partial [Puccinia triticina 1-1 BBBD Race 1]
MASQPPSVYPELHHFFPPLCYPLGNIYAELCSQSGMWPPPGLDRARAPRTGAGMAQRAAGDPGRVTSPAASASPSRPAQQRTDAHDPSPFSFVLFAPPPPPPTPGTRRSRPVLVIPPVSAP